MSRYIRVIFLVSMCFLLVLSSEAQTRRKRIAIMDFDYATVQTNVAALFGTNQDIGKGIADLLVTKLVQDGQYSVIERKALDKILAEQNFSNSDRADPTSAAKIGKLLGVDAILVGSITKFGNDDSHKSIGGGGIGGGHFGIGGVKTTNSKAVCGISARLVDVNTGEILSAVNGYGEASKKGVGLLGAGGGWGGAGGGALDMGSTNFRQTLIGTAVENSVDDTGKQIDSAAANLPTVKVAVNGLVADVDGSTLTLNVGSKAGVQVGDTIQIGHPGRQIKDPATGKVLKTQVTSLGACAVSQVDDSTTTCTFSGGGAPKVGDVASE